MDVRATAIAMLMLTAGAGAAQAAGPCGAPVPAAGTEVHGPVLNVLDGRRLCVALGATPDRWLEVELADPVLTRAAGTPGGDPRGALMSAAFARNVTCTVVDVQGGRALGSCRLDGASVAELAMKPQAIRDSAGWR